METGKQGKGELNQNRNKWLQVLDRGKNSAS